MKSLGTTFSGKTKIIRLKLVCYVKADSRLIVKIVENKLALMGIAAREPGIGLNSGDEESTMAMATMKSGDV